MQGKQHNLICIAIAVGFLVVLQWFAAPVPVFRYLVPAFIFYLAVVGTYNFFYLKSFGEVNLWVWLRSILFLVAAFGLYLIPPTVFLRGGFLLVALPIIYFFELTLGNVGENILFNQVVLSAFGFFLSLAAATYYFINSPSYIYVLLICIFTTLLSRASFELIPVDYRTKWVYAFALGLFTTEVFWSVSFLPLHFAALGFFILDVFYFAWVLCYYFLFNNLTPKKIQFNTALLLIVLALILISTPLSILVS